MRLEFANRLADVAGVIDHWAELKKERDRQVRREMLNPWPWLWTFILVCLAIAVGCHITAEVLMWLAVTR